LKEETIVSQCINKLYESSKVGYVRAATPYFAVFPRKIDDLSFSGFQ
jgi:hypothetical protein